MTSVLYPPHAQNVDSQRNLRIRVNDRMTIRAHDGKIIGCRQFWHVLKRKLPLVMHLQRAKAGASRERSKVCPAGLANSVRASERGFAQLPAAATGDYRYFVGDTVEDLTHRALIEDRCAPTNRDRPTFHDERGAVIRRDIDVPRHVRYVKLPVSERQVPTVRTVYVGVRKRISHKQIANNCEWNYVVIARLAGFGAIHDEIGALTIVAFGSLCVLAQFVRKDCEPARTDIGASDVLAPGLKLLSEVCDYAFHCEAPRRCAA
jgi:hypothetical protein